MLSSALDKNAARSRGENKRAERSNTTVPARRGRVGFILVSYDGAGCGSPCGPCGASSQHSESVTATRYARNRLFPERSGRSATNGYGFLFVGVFIAESYEEIRIPASCAAREPDVGCWCPRR